MKSFLTFFFVLGSYLSYSQANVTAMEYYIDTDPGVGVATSVTITGGTGFVESFTIPNSSLTEGFHVIGIRVQDENSVWSLHEIKTVYVSSSDPVTTSNVTDGEYFVDTDLGYGSGTAFTISSPGS